MAWYSIVGKKCIYTKELTTEQIEARRANGRVRYANLTAR
jgi:hypothetical protein